MCWVMSSDSELESREMPLCDALRQVIVEGTAHLYRVFRADWHTLRARNRMSGTSRPPLRPGHHFQPLAGLRLRGRLPTEWFGFGDGLS